VIRASAATSSTPSTTLVLRVSCNCDHLVRAAMRRLLVSRSALRARHLSACWPAIIVHRRLPLGAPLSS
jgi:hypothetical protein